MTSFDVCKVFKLESEANDRLIELGLSIDILKSVAEAAHLAFLNRTPNDPPFIPGTKAWSAAVVRLRQRLLPEGWRKDDPGNYSLTISDKYSINVVVASGDSYTGTEGMPTTKSVKGIKTELAINSNNAYPDMFEHLLPDNVRLAGRTAEYRTWIFLFNVTEEMIRSELSLPSEIEQGHITQWHERIIMPQITSEPWGAGDENHEEQPIEVPVRRRSKQSETQS